MLGPDSEYFVQHGSKASGESFPGTRKLHGVDSYVTDIAPNFPV